MPRSSSSIASTLSCPPMNFSQNQPIAPISLLMITKMKMVHSAALNIAARAHLFKIMKDKQIWNLWTPSIKMS